MRALFIVLSACVVMTLLGCSDDETSTSVSPDKNHAPAVPQLGIPNTPGDGDTLITLEPTIGWLCADADCDSIEYDIYFGTDPTPPLASSGHCSCIWNTGRLWYETTYYWKVVARDEHGATSTSPTWSFTGPQFIMPLKLGNYWIYEQTVSNDSTPDSMQVAITGTRLMTVNSQQVVGYLWTFYDSVGGAPELASIIYANLDSGLWFLGNLGSDGMVSGNPCIEVLYPSVPGDRWVSELGDNMCIAPQEIMTTPAGTFEVYHIQITPGFGAATLGKFNVDPEHTVIDAFYAPGIGLVGYEWEMSGVEYAIRLSRYHLE